MSAHHYSVGSVADKWRPGCCARATTDDKENRSRLSLQNFFMADQAIKRLGYKLCWVSPEDFLDCCICIVTPNGLIQRRGFGELSGVPRIWLSRGRDQLPYVLVGRAQKSPVVTPPGLSSKTGHPG